MATSEGPSTSPTLLRKLWNPANSEEAWRTFLKWYGPLIYGWCRRADLQHADAEEVSAQVQSKLAKALIDFEYDPEQRFRGWLKRVVDNTLRSFWRERAHRPGAKGTGDTQVHERLQQAEAPGDIESLVDELDQRFDRDLKLLHEITERVQKRVEARTWQAYWQTAIEGKPAAEIAAKLAMTAAAVYVAKNRVGKMLREEGAKLREHT